MLMIYMWATLHSSIWAVLPLITEFTVRSLEAEDDFILDITVAQTVKLMLLTS